MKRENFTADRVAGFKCALGKQQTLFWDGKAPGLGLRVTAKGVKSYIFESRLHGKTLRLTIGNVRTWTVSKAQAEATRLKSLTDQGVDPRQQEIEKRAAYEASLREAKRKNVTLADAWPLYLEARKAKWGERTYKDHVSIVSPGGQEYKRGKGITEPGPLTPLLAVKLAELTSDVVTTWLKEQAAKRPTVAALSYRMLRAFIRWSEDMPEYQGLVPANAWSARQVRDALPKSQAKEGDCLQREQLSAWFNEVRKIPSPVISAYLQALLLTGARREEMASLRWKDVDFHWRSITIRDKVEGTRTIPLPPYLASLLLNLQRINEAPPPEELRKRRKQKHQDWQPSEWVFFSKTAANGRIAEPRIAHNEALQAGGLPHISLHGLRRSFGTLCEWVEMPSGISAQIMGHKPSALAEKHYRRRPLDLLRKWHDQIEAWVLEQARIQIETAAPALHIVSTG